MNKFDLDHWLIHDRESHYKLNTSLKQAFSYQQLTSIKNGSPTTSCSSGNTNTNQTSQLIKTYSNFTEFIENFKNDSCILQNEDTSSTNKLISCLICGVELKFTYVDILKHFQSEHEFNVFDLNLGLDDLEVIQALQMNNLIQLSQGVHIKKRCYVKVPPLLVNTYSLLNSVDDDSKALNINITKVDLIDKEIKILNEIYREQIVEKQIVSWLNSEQFLRRNYNYNSYACIICNATKIQILEAHYNQNQSHKFRNLTNSSTTTASDPASQSALALSSGLNANRLQYYTEEMKTVVLTNHVLGHFNEYCFRCMSCKISWPDRTQLLKHAQECSNSQVVRTKTKYKLKANCRLQLKFYLQSYLDYWNHEKCLETKDITELIPVANNNNPTADLSTTRLNCKIFLKDIMLNKKLFLDQSSVNNIDQINIFDDKKIILKPEKEQEEVVIAEVVEKPIEPTEQEKEPEEKEDENKNDIQMKESVETSEIAEKPMDIVASTSEEAANDEQQTSEEPPSSTTEQPEPVEQQTEPTTAS